MVKVSVIIPCFNDGRFLNDALSSVKCHTHFGKEIEIIVVNDGSSDHFTLDLLKELESRNEGGIKIIHQSNKGPGAARNTGISIAEGSIILPLDCDNKLTIEYLDLAIELSDTNSELNNSADIIYGKQQRFGESKSGKQPSIKKDINSTLIHSNYLDTCAVFKKKVWKELGGYDEKLVVVGYEDWEFWLRAYSASYRFKYIDQPLYHYRLRDDSLITRAKERENYERVKKYVYAKHIGLVMFELERLRKFEYNYKLRKNNPLKYYAKKILGRK